MFQTRLIYSAMLSKTRLFPLGGKAEGRPESYKWPALVPRPPSTQRGLKMDAHVIRTPLRIKGKRFHLTYSQCGELQPDRVYEFLSTLGNDVIRCRIGTELHADGGRHLHVAIQFARPWDRRNTRLFDVDGHHPNIIPKRTDREWCNAWDYDAKHGEFKDWGAPQAEKVEDQAGTTLIDLAEESESYKEFLRAVGDRQLNFFLAKEIWRTITSDEPITITGDNLADQAPGVITNEQLQNLAFDQQDLRSLVLQGPPEIGKSTWAKTRVPLPALWVTNHEDLRGFRNGFHRTIIFDDVCYQHRPRTDQLHIVCRREHRSLWARYCNIRVPRAVWKVFTCNMGDDKLPVAYGMGDPAIDSRVKLVVIRV